jgi:hypothetical protein
MLAWSLARPPEDGTFSALGNLQDNSIRWG